MPDLRGLTAAIVVGDRATAVRLTQEAVDDGLPARAILDAMTEGMAEVGARFQLEQIYVPEMLVAARAMREATAVLEPLLVGAGIRPIATAVVGTIQGDLHDIGKNLVGMMWKGANIEVIDLGNNVGPEAFAAAAQEHGADLIGVSALLTTTMPNMRGVVEAVRSAGLSRTRVIVGGAPVTSAFAHEIGADGYAPDAATAVDVAKSLLALGDGSPGAG
ncbi:MAG: methyltransferase [Chloroflexi bacterium RBG_16_69_14]|nr:MAG: methyltransferase [Chloroflexi bacterium RBG_16_69_14]